MNFKHTFFWLFIFLSFSTIASAQQLTKADLQGLENRVQALETRVSNLEIKVEEMDKRLAAQIQAVHVRIDEMDKRVTAQFQAVHTRIDELDKRLTIAMSILVGVVLAAIALPQLLGYLQAKREREEFQKQLYDQRTEIRQEIHDLRTEMREIRNLGERLDHQFQMMFEKLNQHQQEIDDLKSHRIETTS